MKLTLIFDGKFVFDDDEVLSVFCSSTKTSKTAMISRHDNDGKRVYKDHPFDTIKVTI